MKKISILFICCFTLSCSSDSETENDVEGTLFIPDRFVGDYIGQTHEYSAEIRNHRITLETDEGTVTRIDGTTTADNGTTLFRADLANGENLVLLQGNGYVGITLFRDGVWVISDYYELQ